MIELKFHHFLKWSEIEEIIKKGKNNMVVVKLPNSIYHSKKMKYKIEHMKKHHIIVEMDNDKRGRHKKIDDNLKERILELYREGYSINNISNILKLPKSTIFINVRDEIGIISMERKKEELTSLMYQYKEHLIIENIYDNYFDTLFSELKMYIDENNLDMAHIKIKEISNYAKKLKKLL